MNEKIITGVVAFAVGIGLVLLTKKAKSQPSNMFNSANNVQFWNRDRAAEIKKLLASSRLRPHESVERVWYVEPGLAGPGISPAITLLAEIQKRGDVVVSSTNLLDESASPRMVSEVLISERDKLPPPGSVGAVLTRLS